MITLDQTKKNLKKKIPHLRKVYYGSYDRGSLNSHPVIRMGGKYLESFGFEIGDAIEVDFQPQRITITKVLQ